MSFTKDRYDRMNYQYCGKSGLKLPEISLGLWHNFGGNSDEKETTKMLKTAFNHGITHFDLANNYGPPPGSAEKNFGKILKKAFKGYRDELIISSKAGFDMWPGPYGKGGSRKYLISSLDQSLKRMNIDYVDIFYHHCPDYDVPLEESMHALEHIVRSGKALYAGISNYNGERTAEAAEILNELGTPFIIHQVKLNLYERSPETDLFPVLREKGLGCIAFSPLAQGLLTDKYLNEIPKNSRIADKHGFLQESDLDQNTLNQIKQLKKIADNRGQSLSQLSIQWVLHHSEVTSALIGVRNTQQLKENLEVLKLEPLSDEDLSEIDRITTN